MTINQLEYFLTLSRTLNYTKASKLLHLTQPHLSKTIMALEQDIGARLFMRNKRDVRLTQAGEVFYAEIDSLLSRFNNAVAKTKEASEGFYGAVKVGFLGTAMARLLPTIINRFQKLHPNISLNLFDYTYSSLQDTFYADKLDVAILPDRELDDAGGLEKKFLIADDMCVAVNGEHPYAHCEYVELYDMKCEPFIIMDPKVSVRDSNMVTTICLEQNFLPKIVMESNTLTNLLMMVECKMGISILAKHMSHMATENVKFPKILGYENYFKLVCAWKKNKNPCAEQFVDVVAVCCDELRERRGGSVRVSTI
ncbi:MAG: LysR family transcriptional regulator [Clostridiales Family XIII bacterium]|jgi:DNA-binding transcriptional LysR family regulator|nr:LysR family transcriptional regulator [Clostridiales Family XIII bacterium]